MKFLFDQNLSPRLPESLANLYPGSLHVRDVGLREAEDSAIWEYAKGQGLVIVSKDSDFQQRSLLYGPPPKFVWVRLENCSVHAIESLLRKHSVILHHFDRNPQRPLLLLP